MNVVTVLSKVRPEPSFRRVQGILIVTTAPRQRGLLYLRHGHLHGLQRPGYSAREGDRAEAIATAINGVGNSLRISATSSSNIVTLTNEVAGTYGNRPILKDVTSGTFRVLGMSDGAGYDCLAGTGYTVNSYCDPSWVCVAGTFVAHSRTREPAASSVGARKQRRASPQTCGCT